MSELLRILVVEDNEDDAALLLLELQRGGFRVDALRVDTEGLLRGALATREWDLILSDFAMPSFDGLHAFTIVRDSGIDVPFIFVSGALGEERAVDAMRAGAKDYFIKGHLARLNVAIRRELAEARNRIARREADETAHRNQRRLAMAVEASGEAVFEYWLPDQSFFSERWTEILGYSSSELPSRSQFWKWLLTKAHPDDAVMVERDQAALEKGDSRRFRSSFRLAHKDGRWIDVEISARLLSSEADGSSSHLVGVLQDLSERRGLEDQLRQAQKMEAVGQLASGIAHDFNNLLTVIYSFTSIAMEELTGHATHDRLAQVMKAARKAGKLTEQLLTFSRKKPVAPRVHCMNDTIRDTDKMLCRLLGDHVNVILDLNASLWNVRIDSGALEQVLVNLAVNARDAMPQGGTLTYKTENVTRTDSPAIDRAIPLEPGEYVCLTVTDTGTGMDETTQERIFEPFFTTKGVGRGTGLGLSTCYGIVEQAGGHIGVQSEIGKGTTFRIHLPRAFGPTEAAVAIEEPGKLRGTETILVTEDDDTLRDLISIIVSQHGYDVVTAANATEALSKYEDRGGAIDLLLTDIIMPGTDGKELAEKLLTKDPSLKVVFMSGYVPEEDGIGSLELGRSLLQKPFTPKSLCTKIRQELDVRC